MATAYTDETTGVKVKEVAPALGLKLLMIELPATSDTADTVAIDMAKYGGSKPLWHFTCYHSTEDSIVVASGTQCTTAVSGTTITFTTAHSQTNVKVEILFAFK